MQLPVLAVFMLQVTGIIPESIYTVISPKVIRPDLDFHVAVSTFNVSGTTEITVGIEGKQDSGGPVNSQQTIVVEPDSTQIVNLQVGGIGSGTYKLVASGTGAVTFSNSTDLFYQHKSLSVFVQTDKAIYKPGQLVQFRAIIVSPQLRPSVIGSIDIHITDGKENRVKQWSRVFAAKGVFSADLQLSDQPVFGDWSIVVLASGQTFTKKFQVAEYVLPKFEVSLDLPAFATFKDSKIVATVKAKYTYGKPVRGEATIAAYPEYKVSYIQPFFTEPVRKVVQINGKTDVTFDLTNELRLTDDYQRDIRFDVTVTEALTQRSQNSTASIMLYRHKFKLELIKTADNYKPGLKYTAFLKVAYQDDKPVQDEGSEVVVRHGYSHNHDIYQNTTYKIPKNGIIELTFYPPADEDSSVLGIEAYYKGQDEWFSTINSAQSPSATYLQATLSTTAPKVGDEVTINLNCTSPMKSYTYQVLGRGDIIQAKSIVAEGSQEQSFSFILTAQMAPTARVIVSFIHGEEVVADSLSFDVEGTFQNFADIDLNPLQAEPGADVNINVKAKPNSFVGLLGVDQSVLLLRTGNDISQKQVLDELKKYDTGDENDDHTSWLQDLRDRKKRSLFWWPKSTTASEVFSSSGVVVLTNGLIYHVEDANTGGRSTSAPLAIGRPIPPKGASAIRVDKGPGIVTRALTRPPLAGPYAFSWIPKPRDNRPKVYLRKDIQPTWIFDSMDSGSDGVATFSKTAPDTITSWIISAFSIDSLYGLGISEKPSKLQIFRPFFVQLNLPYSIVRGESVAVQIVVFNYMSKDQTAEVTLESNGDDFDFVGSAEDENEIRKLELFKKKKVAVKSQDGSSISFLIRPKKLGYIDIKVTAKTASAGDAELRKLLVKAEGETIHKNKAVLIDLRLLRNFKATIDVDIPAYAVSGSQRVEVEAIADIMGASINNLDKLIRIPFGCGEQNMVNFVPNIVALEYLKSTGQIQQTKEIQAKAMRNIETGYQRELTYKREDGSYSAFGSADPSGSTWLTAFVARSFIQAQPYIAIEDSVIDKALEWLSVNQAANGSFPEVGKVSHSDMQGGSGKGVPLTAYVLLAFLEKSNSQSKFKETLDKAKRFLKNELSSLRDPYVISVVAYALHLARDTSDQDSFTLLEEKKNSTLEDKLFWSRALTAEEIRNPRNLLTKSVDIEMTAYALLTYIERGLTAEALPIMKWLVSKRNSNGGFESTQDTVIGIYALAKLAQKITVPEPGVDVTFEFEGNSHIATLNKANAMVLQKFVLPPTTRQVNISAVGKGFSIVQVSYSYNVNVTGEWPLFNLDPQLSQRANENRMQLTICSSFVGMAGLNASNMAVLDVSLPSGFTVDEDSVLGLTTYKDVKLAEIKEGGSGVLMYFDSVTQETICPAVTAYRTYKVAEQRKVPVVMYDYYDNSRRARVFYNPVASKICDICDGSECKARCAGTAGWKVEDGESVGGVETEDSRDKVGSGGVVYLLSHTSFAIILTCFLYR